MLRFSSNEAVGGPGWGGVRVSGWGCWGISILTDANQKGSVHHSGSPLWEKKTILIGFLMKSIINRWLNKNQTSD